MRQSERRRRDRGFITNPPPTSKKRGNMYIEARPFKAKHVARCGANHVAQHASQLATRAVTLAPLARRV